MTESMTWKKKVAESAKADSSTDAAGAGAASSTEATPTARPAAPRGKRGRQQDSATATPAKRGKHANEAASSSPGAGATGLVPVDRSPVCSSWLEDVLAAVKLSVTGDAASLKEKIKFQVLAMQVALEFAWTKKVVFAGSTYVTWSTLRPQLVNFVANVEKVSGQLAEALGSDASACASGAVEIDSAAANEDVQMSCVKEELRSPQKLRRQASLAAMEALEKSATQSVPVPPIPGLAPAPAGKTCNERTFILSELMGFVDRDVVEQATGRIEACWVTSPAIKLLESLCEAIVNQTVFSQLPLVKLSVSASTATKRKRAC